jgi:periplasmic protein TonB
MLQDETQAEHHLERSLAHDLEPTVHDAEVQRKRMLMALGILVVALAAVVLKDWDFWFPPTSEVEEAAVHHRSTGLPASATPAPVTIQRKPLKPAAPLSAPAAATADAPPMSATTERAALPPMQIEVVAGNRHINVPAKSSAIHVDVDSGDTSAVSTTASASPAPSTSTGSGDRVKISPITSQNVTVSVPPDYPLLARQMKVQGAVSLQALISREGSIQELQILSGPAILAVAAREAVKQWHFKPYLQNGQPVETEARITVNFTISTN